MKIFLSCIEQPLERIDGKTIDAIDYMVANNVRTRWNLISYYYARNKQEIAEKIRDNSEQLLVDSGAHSLQKGLRVHWDDYTDAYARFINNFDRENVLGYFEMDVDNIIGYPKVLELRKKLEKVSNKIIPVWHKNRGIEDFREMCCQYSGKIVAVTGFRNEDIQDDQYVSFLKYAKRYGCKVHCLGMTRKAILDKVPFDFTDSSSWRQSAIHGVRMNGRGKQKVPKTYSKENRGLLYVNNYIEASKMQEQYYRKWRAVCHD